MTATKPSRKYASRAAVILTVATLTAVNATAEPVRTTVRIQGGETLYVRAPNGANFFLSFAAVVSDERCPAKVHCAWANPPVIALEASAEGVPVQPFQVTPGGPGGKKEGRYLGATIGYIDLQPAPRETAEFAKLRPLPIYTVILSISAEKTP